MLELGCENATVGKNGLIFILGGWRACSFVSRQNFAHFSVNIWTCTGAANHVSKTIEFPGSNVNFWTLTFFYCAQLILHLCKNLPHLKNDHCFKIYFSENVENWKKKKNSIKWAILYPTYFIYFWSKIKRECIKLIVMMSTFQITLTDSHETYQFFANA